MQSVAKQLSDTTNMVGHTLDDTNFVTRADVEEGVKSSMIKYTILLESQIVIAVYSTFQDSL